MRIAGYVNGSFGLPAELYPHIQFALIYRASTGSTVKNVVEISGIEPLTS